MIFEIYLKTMRAFTRSAPPLALILIAAVIALSQTNGKGLRPFAPGEVLTYEAKLSKIINGIGVAYLKFTV